MTPDESLLGVARSFSSSMERAARAYVEPLPSIGGFRARVRYGRKESSAEHEDACTALSDAFRSVQTMLVSG